MRAATASTHWPALGVLLALVAGCDPIFAAISPSAPAFPDSEAEGPLTACEAACGAKAAACSREDCRRGCGIVLDRWVEREGEHVVRCVATAKPRCDVWAWSACAARVGPHADGGPPPPPEVTDDDVE